MKTITENSRLPLFCNPRFLALGLACTIAVSAQQRSLPLADPFDPTRDPGDTDPFGSTNVPMDSWVYATLERLGDMGYIEMQSVTIRPWTRKECERQLHEAESNYLDAGNGEAADAEAERLISDLEREFRTPAGTSEAAVESVYAREGTIAGPALTDSYHFGQTWWNDFGRPLGRGNSAIAGFSARASNGRFFFYDRQEVQQHPTTMATTAAISALFRQIDLIPVAQIPNAYPVTAAEPAGVRQRPIELYAGFAFAGNQLSFGKQELYWGPTTMGPWSFSSNAEPTYNLRLVATRPHPVPYTDGNVTYRFDLVFGKLSGHHYPARPYYNGQKAEFSFFNTLELGFTRWSVLFGQGHPMTLGSLGRNLFSANSTGSTFLYGDRADPGDRKSGFDFQLHVPGLRKYVTIYADGYSDDDVSPLNAPRHAVWNPGIYLPSLPLLPHVDLRFEVSSSLLFSGERGGNQYFINNQYFDSNTNKGFLLGNAVGRDARAYEARSTWWKSARTTFGTGFRQTKGGAFLPGESTVSDIFTNVAFQFRREWSAQVFAQHERWKLPVLNSAAQHNESGWLQIVWTPTNKRLVRTEK